jgi:hypothetical protein
MTGWALRPGGPGSGAEAPDELTAFEGASFVGWGKLSDCQSDERANGSKAMHKSEGILLLQSSVWILNVRKLGGVERIQIEMEMNRPGQSLTGLVPLEALLPLKGPITVIANMRRHVAELPR